MVRMFLLLQQEGYLFRSCLTTGLTALRKADLNDPGAYYTAFFQLSTGLERLLKSIVVIQHLATHGAAPTEKALRRYGHDLMELTETTTRAESAAAVRLRKLLAVHTLNHDLMTFLSNFSRASRYFNLNALAGDDHGTSDPIEDWNAIVRRVLHEDEDSKRKGVEESTLPSELTLTARKTLEMYTLRQAQERAARRVIVRLVRILAAMRERLGEVVGDANRRLGERASSVPYMIEFLNFTYQSDGEVLRKKRWP